MHATNGGHVRRTVALRKGSTLPSNLSGLPKNIPEAEDSGGRDPEQVNGSSQVEIRQVKGRSLGPMHLRGTVDYGNDGTQFDNDYHHSYDGDGDDDDADSDLDDFTDDDDDEIVYENPVGLIPM